MNKVHVFTALLVVMAVTTIVSPVITGTIAKSAYLEQIDNIPSQAGFHINHNSYEQGWFSSKAESELIIDIGHPEFQSLNLIFNSNITHGPVLKDEDGLKLGLAYSEISTKLTNLPEELQLMVEDTFSDYSFDLTAFIGFDQEIKTTFIFPEHKSEVDDISYDFGGLEIFAVGDLAMENSKGDIQLDSSSVESDDVVLSFSDSHGDFNFNKVNDYLYLGTANFMMPSIDVKSNTFNVKLNELNVLAETKENAGKIDLYEQISVKESVVHG